MTISKLLASGVAVFVAISSGAAQAQEGDPAQGEKVFARCRACHSVEPGQNRVGPTLAGVVGRQAGTVEGYSYSDAMANADIVWDEATLHQFLAKPQEVVPGTKMLFAGLPNEQDRADIIAYLKQTTQE